ncbi:MAG: BTAD domain-containing putative transcriptional regulator [Gemmatimonadaceae bacterium]
MTALRTLGTLDVRGKSGESLSELCARPKPLALLVYLTLVRPRGFQSQDVALAMFWSESDTSRAQLSMRQAIHLLRRQLGDEIITRRSRSEIGVQLSAVACDALAFDDAIANCEFEAALDLYQGDLLPGFYVPDAPEFERWLSGERSRLRELAIKAARMLMQRSDLAADETASARWAERWVSITPSDERAVQCAIARYITAKDNSAALRAYNNFVRALGSDGAAPSTETESLIAPVRRVQLARSTGEQDAAKAVAKVVAEDVVNTEPIGEPMTKRPGGEHGEARQEEIEKATDARIPVRATRSRWIKTTIATAATVAFAAAALWSRRTNLADTTNATAPTVTRVAVFPFTVRGGESVSYLREGMVDLLSARLDGAGGLTTVDPQALLAYEHANTANISDPKEALSIAEHFAAAQFILGSITDVGGRIEITASSYDRRGKLRATVAGSANDESHVLAAIDEVARDLLAEQFRSAPERIQHIAATSTTSLSALKAFLEGERDIRNGQRGPAVDAFKRAIHEDSTFALAHYRLSTSALSPIDAEAIRNSVAVSMRYANQLPQHERLSLKARNLVEIGAIEEADRQYRDIVAAYPDDADAWNQLGELVFHTGPWRGRPFTESRGAFERVLKLHPDDANALLHLARIATIEKRRNDVVSLVASALALNPEREALLELHGLRAGALHDPVEEKQLRELVRTNASASGIDDDVSLVAWRVATYTDDPRAGASIISSFASEASNSPLQIRDHAALAHMFAAYGRWRDAFREIEIVERSDRRMAAETRANIELSWPQASSTIDRANTRKMLDQPASFETSASLDPTQRVRHAYLVGALALLDEDTLTVRKQQRALAALGEGVNAETELAIHLAHELDARLRWHRGDAAGALREVESGWPKGSARKSLPLYQGEAYTQAHERYFRGELLESLGRDAEAIRWYASVADDQGASIALSAPVHLARARIADRQGESAIAINEYQQALALWANADAAVSADVRTSRARLELLLSRQSATEDLTKINLPAGAHQP